MKKKGYLYCRTNSSYRDENVTKMGITDNPSDRDSQYATGEVKRGYFIVVFEVPFECMRIVENLLQYEFRELNIKYDAGTEFYDEKIVNRIEPYLKESGIEYRKLLDQEISVISRRNRLRSKIRSVIKK